MFGQHSTCQTAKSQALKPSCLVWVLTHRFLAKKSGVDPNFLHFFTFWDAEHFKKWFDATATWDSWNPFDTSALARGLEDQQICRTVEKNVDIFQHLICNVWELWQKVDLKTHWSNNQVLVAGLGMLQWPGHSARQGGQTKYTKHLRHKHFFPRWLHSRCFQAKSTWRCGPWMLTSLFMPHSCMRACYAMFGSWM